MEIDPRAALDRLIEALTAHYDAVTSNQDPEAPAVISATATLEDAFVTYDDALITNFDVDLPFDVYDDDTWVYPGHGDDTTLGAERPHLQEWRTRGW